MAYKDPAKKRAYAKAYYESHREYYTERSLAWRAANREKANAWARRWRAAHTDRARATNRRWSKAHPDRTRELRIEAKFRRYGLTLDQYHALLERQGEQCAICRCVIKPVGRETHIDHDHVSGTVRGLLCERCNVGLGSFKDRPGVLRAAAAYLERHHA